MFKGSEIFSSLQGEGILSGVPMTFIRFAGCNLSCTFCDTKYAWKAEEEWTIDHVLSEVMHFPNNWVCLTGGEPLLQDLDALIGKLADDSYRITVETNGTIEPPYYVFRLTNLWSVSPKLDNSGMTQRNDEVVAKFLTHPHVQLKFVCEGTKDVFIALQYVEHLEKTFSVSAKLVPIVFQPQGIIKVPPSDWITHSIEAERTHLYIAKLKNLWETVRGCKSLYANYDLRVLPQLHRLVFGQEVRKV